MPPTLAQWVKLVDKQGDLQRPVFGGAHRHVCIASSHLKSVENKINNRDGGDNCSTDASHQEYLPTCHQQVIHHNKNKARWGWRQGGKVWLESTEKRCGWWHVKSTDHCWKRVQSSFKNPKNYQFNVKFSNKTQKLTMENEKMCQICLGRQKLRWPCTPGSWNYSALASLQFHSLDRYQTP